MNKIDVKAIAAKIKEALSKLKIKETLLKLKIGKFKLQAPNFKDQKEKRKFFLIVIAVIIGLIVLAKTTSNIRQVLFNKKPAAAAKDKAAGISFDEEAIPVKAFKVKKTDFKDTLPAIGNIRGFKEVDLKFQVAGIIESFNFEEGEKIQEGDIISSLVQKEALLKLKYAEVSLTKDQTLFDLGAVHKIKLEQTKLEYESAKNELDKTNIYAMSNGLLGSRILDVGNYVTPNDKVGVFVDTEKVYAEFSIIEKDVPKVSLGQKAEVFVDAHPGKAFSGVVDRIAPIIEGRSRTQTIKIELDNKDGLLKPGMFVRALIATYEKKDVIVIPSSGLKKKENDYLVYVIVKEEPKGLAGDADAKDKEKKKWWQFGFGKKGAAPKAPADAKGKAEEKPAEFGTIEIRKITLGYMTQDLVEVSEGLKEDELIVIEVQEDFKDKTRVEIVEVQEGLF